MPKKIRDISPEKFDIRKMLNLADDEYLRDECRAMVGMIAGSRGLLEDRPAMFARVATLSGLTVSTVAQYWWRKIKRPYGSDIAKLAAAAETARLRRETEQRLAKEIATLAGHHNAERSAFVAEAPRWMAALAAPAMPPAANKGAPQVARKRAGAR